MGGGTNEAPDSKKQLKCSHSKGNLVCLVAVKYDASKSIYLARNKLPLEGQNLTWWEQKSESMPGCLTSLAAALCPKQPRMSRKGGFALPSEVVAAGCPNSKSNTTSCKAMRPEKLSRDSMIDWFLEVSVVFRNLLGGDSEAQKKCKIQWSDNIACKGMHRYRKKKEWPVRLLR